MYYGLIENDVNKVKDILQNFEKYLSDVELNISWPNNIFLAAAANIYNVNIVVAKTFNKNENYVDKISYFEPHTGFKPQNFVIFGLIYPHYYNVLHPISTTDMTILGNRNRFAVSTEFRQKIIDKCHQTAVRRVLQEDSKGHRRNKSNLNIEKQEAEVKVYQDTFSSNYQTTKFINNRFRIVKFKSIRDEDIFEKKE